MVKSLEIITGYIIRMLYVFGQLLVVPGSRRGAQWLVGVTEQLVWVPAGSLAVYRCCCCVCRYGVGV